MSQSDQGYNGPFKFTYPDDYDRVPAIKWQVQGVLQKGGLIWFYGPPKSGKTYVAVSWAGAVQSGQPWVGLKVEQADVVYLALEGHDGIVRRHKAWKEANGILMPTRTALIRDPINLLDKDGSVRPALEAFKRQGKLPGLIIVDTYQRAAVGSDIGSPKETVMALANLDWFRGELGNPTTVLLAHSRKNDDRYLGAQNIYGWVDGMITLTGKGDHVELSCDGFRDGEPFSPIELMFGAVKVLTEDGPQAERAIVGRATMSDKLDNLDKVDSGKVTQATTDKASVVEALRKAGGSARHKDLLMSVGGDRGRLSAALKALVTEGKVTQPDGIGHKPWVLVGDGGDRGDDGLVGGKFSLEFGLVPPLRGAEKLNQIPNLVFGAPIPNQTKPNVGSLLGDALSSTTIPPNHNIADLQEALTDDTGSESDRLANRPS